MLLYVTTATFGPLFLRGIPERKNGAGFFQCLTIEFLEKIILFVLGAAAILSWQGAGSYDASDIFIATGHY